MKKDEIELNKVEIDAEIDTTELEKYMTKDQIQTYIDAISKHIDSWFSGDKVDKNYLTKLAIETIKIFNIPDEALIGNLNNSVVNMIIDERRKLVVKYERKIKKNK